MLENGWKYYLSIIFPVITMKCFYRLILALCLRFFFLTFATDSLQNVVPLGYWWIEQNSRSVLPSFASYSEITPFTLFKVNGTTYPAFYMFSKCKQKQNKNLWNEILNHLSNSPITFTWVSKARWWIKSVPALCHTATSSYSLTVCNFPSHQVTKVSTVSLSKLKLTLHLSVCIKAAYSIAELKLFFKQ